MRARECPERCRLRTVFPDPLRPTMSVRGLGKVMTCVFSGLKLRMPRMSSLRRGWC